MTEEQLWQYWSENPDKLQEAFDKDPLTFLSSGLSSDWNHRESRLSSDTLEGARGQEDLAFRPGGTDPTQHKIQVDQQYVTNALAKLGDNVLRNGQFADIGVPYTIMVNPDGSLYEQKRAGRPPDGTVTLNIGTGNRNTYGASVSVNRVEGKGGLSQGIKTIAPFVAIALAPYIGEIVGGLLGDVAAASGTTAGTTAQNLANALVAGDTGAATAAGIEAGLSAEQAVNLVRKGYEAITGLQDDFDAPDIEWQPPDVSDLPGDIQIQVPDYSEPVEDAGGSSAGGASSAPSEPVVSEPSVEQPGGGILDPDVPQDQSPPPSTDPEVDYGETETSEHNWIYKGGGVFENRDTGEVFNNPDHDPDNDPYKVGEGYSRGDDGGKSTEETERGPETDTTEPEEESDIPSVPTGVLDVWDNWKDNASSLEDVLSTIEVPKQPSQPPSQVGGDIQADGDIVDPGIEGTFPNPENPGSGTGGDGLLNENPGDDTNPGNGDGDGTGDGDGDGDGNTDTEYDFDFPLLFPVPDPDGRSPATMELKQNTWESRYEKPEYAEVEQAPLFDFRESGWQDPLVTPTGTPSPSAPGSSPGWQDPGVNPTDTYTQPVYDNVYEGLQNGTVSADEAEAAISNPQEWMNNYSNSVAEPATPNPDTGSGGYAESLGWDTGHEGFGSLVGNDPEMMNRLGIGDPSKGERAITNPFAISAAKAHSLRTPEQAAQYNQAIDNTRFANEAFRQQRSNYLDGTGPEPTFTPSMQTAQKQVWDYDGLLASLERGGLL